MTEYTMPLTKVHPDFYQTLIQRALRKEMPDIDDLNAILNHPDVELLPLLQAAYKVREYFCGKEVNIHILNNVKNGRCPEDCNYCAQGTASDAEITEYPEKSDEEVLEEAARAYESGAHRYCMVYAGRGTGEQRAKKIGELIRKIKTAFPLEVCVSGGLMSEPALQQLKDAGLDRLNHNLNTTQLRYDKITTTHTYQDRLNTLQGAHKLGLQVCSGIIAGMGENDEERIELASELRSVNARSIPVNFLIPIEGNKLTEVTGITPQKALRILCMFRFTNPDAEIRAAAGREVHLRSMEVMSLYPANSLFLDGYLNTRGNDARRTLQMIKDAGFTIRSDKELDELLERQSAAEKKPQWDVELKDEKDLKPAGAN